jgi:hypothetical protein
MTQEQYLIDVGIRASDNGHDISSEERVQLRDNVEYFKKCYFAGLSAYKALLFFGDYLKGDYDIDSLVDERKITDDSLICNFELGIENCGFMMKNAYICKHVRKCDMCGNK